MLIREAFPADLPAASQLWFERQCLLQQSEPLIQLAPDALSMWQRTASDWLTDEKAAMFVGESRGELAGFVAVGICADAAGLQPAWVGRLLAMAVDLHQPHAALSSQLLEEVEAWLRRHTIEALEIDVPLFYPVEAAFWRGRGARPRSHRYWLSL
ncbi:MAG: hypothetical protein OXE95_12060 [Chloroflexi bacterium]|nr:hypothetical protein [Chloroflexota bacterium]MCY4248295.1 hypothetical protein [Chloroflexota bacterium]